jgi:heme/copper-type cytochrome/quinol oxidase subunit 3
MTAQAVAQPGGARPAPIALGVIIFIASETMFFGALLGAYYTLRSLTPVWPPAGVHLTDTEMAVATAILLASSVPAHLAVGALRRGRPDTAVRRLILTAVMGVVFLVLKVHDWLTAGFTISSHAYGTIFFTLTGFHALHMAVGIILLLGLAAKVAAGAYAAEYPPAAPQPAEVRGVRRYERLAKQPESGGPDAVAYYWHFVDAVWIAVFSSIWLIR